jgi:transposase InsO family protein
VEELHRLAQKHPRYEYELVTGKLRQRGWRVNEKRVQRLWRKEGLKVVKRQHRRRRLSGSTVVRQAALYPNHVWSWDFVFDRREDGRRGLHRIYPHVNIPPHPPWLPLLLKAFFLPFQYTEKLS